MFDFVPRTRSTWKRTTNLPGINGKAAQATKPLSARAWHSPRWFSSVSPGSCSLLCSWSDFFPSSQPSVWPQSTGLSLYYLLGQFGITTSCCRFFQLLCLHTRDILLDAAAPPRLLLPRPITIVQSSIRFHEPPLLLTVNQKPIGKGVVHSETA